MKKNYLFFWLILFKAQLISYGLLSRPCSLSILGLVEVNRSFIYRTAVFLYTYALIFTHITSPSYGEQHSKNETTRIE